MRSGPLRASAASTPESCGRARARKGRRATSRAHCLQNSPAGAGERAMANISPVLRKGAILSLDATTGIPLGTVMRQYKPDSITRPLKPQRAGEEADRSEILRLKGPPIETINCDIEIDATDQLAAGKSTAINLGIQPQLSALELLVYPSSAVLIANEVL